MQSVPHPLVTRQSRMIEQSEMIDLTATSSQSQPLREFLGHSTGCTATIQKVEGCLRGLEYRGRRFCSLCSACLKQISIVRLKNSMVIVSFYCRQRLLTQVFWTSMCKSRSTQVFAIDEKKLQKLQHAQERSKVLSWNSGECDYQKAMLKRLE